MKMGINILPAKEKREISFAQKSKSLDFWFIRVIFLLVFLSLSLLSVLAFLSLKERSLQKQFYVKGGELERVGIRSLERSVDELNQLLRRAHLVESSQLKLSKILEDLFLFLPAGIKLDLFSFDKQKNQIYLSGIADSRGDLLALQENLVKSNNFKNINVPLEVLAKKENVEFDLSFLLNQP